MLQDYQLLTDDQLENLEKQTLRMIVQAVQEYSKEARDIFQSTPISGKKKQLETELIVLAEDLVQYALEVAECYPINKRFAGFIDYKRVRWMPTPYGLIPQALLVDAKASTEHQRANLQQSQLPMDADFTVTRGTRKGIVVQLPALLPAHLPIKAHSGKDLLAVTTAAFIQFHYTSLASKSPPYRTLHTIYILLVPHRKLKPRYNPNATTSFFGEGKHSPSREEEPRIRVYFDRLIAMCPWRVQTLKYTAPGGYTEPLWCDAQAGVQGPVPVQLPFEFIGR